MTTPLTISFVVPIYEIERIRSHFDELVQSLLKQTYPHTEIIFVNDASPDNSADILQELADQHPHIRVLTHGHNQGQGPARNSGAAAATGDYIWFVDQDDMVAQNACQILADEAQAYNYPDIICFQHCYNIESLSTQLSSPSQCITYEDYNKSRQHRIDIDHFLLSYYDGRDLMSWRHIIKTDLARSCQSPNFPHEDVVHTFSILMRANSLARVNATLYFWRHHDLNTHKERDFTETKSGYAKALQVTQETARQFSDRQVLHRYVRYHHAFRQKYCIEDAYVTSQSYGLSTTQATSVLEKFVPNTWNARLYLVRDVVGYRLHLKHCSLLNSWCKPKISRYTYYYRMTRTFIYISAIEIPPLLLCISLPSTFYRLRHVYARFRKAVGLNP